MTTSPSHSFSFSLIFLFITLAIVAQAAVPAANTFRYVNDGPLGEYIVEYFADYHVTPIFTFPSTVCFYNTTPNAYTLAIRMGVRQSESIMRWVWDANRGNPVREGAMLTFGTNGNLVLADVDGRIAWQTDTANKGVVGLSLLPTGNLVLYDSRNRFVWQSFDYPTDTLLVGQVLRQAGPNNKLVSRVSNKDGSKGAYSFILEKKRMALYMKSKNSPNPLPYYKYFEFGPQQTITSIVFDSQPEYDTAYAYEIRFELFEGNVSAGTSIVARPKYNSTYSMLRVGSDGSFKAYTYYDKVDWGAWEITYSLFDLDYVYGVSECKLPTTCGSLGVCEDSQCVACPTPKGLLGYSKTCAPPTLPPCKNGVNSKKYYKVVGVEHFMNEYNDGEGPLDVSECRKKCNNDCGCLGFFYKEESSKCLIAPELGTLTKVVNSSHMRSD
ncbi:hypothetical protein AQUCO_02100222v1 [Aquilegia coerulea]|uniref:Bulb-type lectin domain-containing protein n=1 Tax=Aquilegia coerulea TaxID=218851 RepID=A0A2G5DG44_AQUCA|nr:hypothetical protein AQUCO_02100222v1 [Aquilegia coerulea]